MLPICSWKVERDFQAEQTIKGHGIGGAVAASHRVMPGVR